ncbi:MAG: glycerophosphodiester phosphodiesterase [Clostridia bacterium]|nr:glycerophosphodiester phosphodiesterase [Clostridia bacterium]
MDPLFIFLIVLALIIISLLFLLCLQTSGRKTSAMEGLMIAHRGLHDDIIPENSLAAFRAAAEKGYGLELDIRLNKEGKVIVFHDDNLKRVTGVDKKTAEADRDDMQNLRLKGTSERIPYFREVLDQIDGRVPILVEFKPGKNMEELCRKAEELLGDYKGEYFIQSFDPRVLIWYRKNRPDILRGQLSEFFHIHGTKIPRITEFILRNLLFGFLSRPDFIAYNLEDIKRALGLRLCMKIYHPKLLLWVIRNGSQLEQAKSLGALPIFEMMSFTD